MKRGLIISAWWAATPDRNMTWRTHADYLCRSAPFPRCPARFSGCTGSAPGEGGVGGTAFKDVVASSQTRKKAARRSQNIQIHSRFISEIGWWNKWPTNVLFFFACSGNGKRLRRKDWERENRKKTFSSTGSCFSNLCHGRKSKSQLLWSMPPRELSFVLLYPVCSGTSLETKS